MSRAPLPAHAGCTICGAGRDRMMPAGGDRHCGACGSLSHDRIIHAVLTGDLRDEIELAGARVLLFGVSACQTLHVFREAEQYRCDGAESAWADLIAEPSDLSGLPGNCFDILVANPALAAREDLELALSEMQRVLIPGGWLLAPAPESGEDEIDGWQRQGSEARRRLIRHLRRHCAAGTFRAVDPVTRRSGGVNVGRKDALSIEAQPPEAVDFTGYAYHLSRKSGRRIIFCLDGPSRGDRLPVESASREIVGHITIDSYAGGCETPPEPWAEGFRFPPRATFELNASLPSGVYAVDKKIPFVYRSHRAAAVAVLMPSHTAAAFNNAGGRSLYATPEVPSADVLSFHRPLSPRLLLEGTWPFLKWFATANPYAQDTTYLVDSDLEDPDALDGVEVLIVIGRSEYWTRAMREHFDAYIGRGGRVLLLCSELMYWQVRVDLARHQLYRYKDVDPHPDPLQRTTVWHHPSLQYPIYPGTGCELWHGGFSAVREGIGWGGMRIVCPDSPLLATTGLETGEVVQLPDASVWDGAPIDHDKGGVPEVDFGDSPPWRHEVIGYNLVKPIAGEAAAGRPATSLWLVLRRTPESGTVIHCGTMGWCGPCAIGLSDPNSDLIRATILRMLAILRDDAWPFSRALGAA